LERYLWDCSFGISVEQFSAVRDDTVVLLSRSGKEAGNVDKRDNWDVESVAESHEATSLKKTCTWPRYKKG
jgi:hypothetical protein